MKMIEEEPNPRVRNMVLHSLFGPSKSAPFKLSSCRSLLEREAVGSDEDLSRYCALLLIVESLNEATRWVPTNDAHNSVKLLVRGLGLKARMQSKTSVLESFFKTQGIDAKFSWKKALGQNLRDAEHRCIRLRQLEIGDPTARVMMLDTFNEVLIQSFSQRHPALQAAYTSAAGRNAQPDFGNWLENGTFKKLMGTCADDLRAVHKSRVKADLAHARSKSGKPTKSITHKEARRLLYFSLRAWTVLVVEWRKYV